MYHKSLYAQYSYSVSCSYSSPCIHSTGRDTAEPYLNSWIPYIAHFLHHDSCTLHIINLFGNISLYTIWRYFLSSVIFHTDRTVSLLLLKKKHQQAKNASTDKSDNDKKRKMSSQGKSQSSSSDTTVNTTNKPKKVNLSEEVKGKDSPCLLPWLVVVFHIHLW